VIYSGNTSTRSSPFDDNSTDATAAVIRRLAAVDPRVKPIFRSPPNGVGLAIADGYRAATGQYVLSMDSDFQHLLPSSVTCSMRGQGLRRGRGQPLLAHSVLLNYPWQKIVANRGFHALAQVVLRRRFAT